MKYRPPAPSPHVLRVSSDRWLFGYADIVTLLFAVFASLYAATQRPAQAAAPDASSVATAPKLMAPAPESPRLEALLADAVTLPGVETTTNQRGFVISLPEAGSFGGGSADLSRQAVVAIRALAARLSSLPNQVRVEGHTDDVPMSTAAFESNWELSTARATRVVQLLIAEGVDPARLSAAGYGEYRPRLPNVNAAARARNRRVDVVVIDAGVAAREEPGVDVQ